MLSHPAGVESRGVLKVGHLSILEPSDGSKLCDLTITKGRGKIGSLTV